MLSTNAATNMTTTTATATAAAAATKTTRSSSSTTARTSGNDFDTLILPHRAALCAQARRLTGGNISDAEDLVQETMLRAYTRLDQVTTRETVGPWLHTILRNLFINEYHKKKRAPQAVELDKAEVSARNTFAAASTSRSPESAVINQMEHSALLGAVSKLPDPYRDILILADMEGMAYQDIAEKMQMPLGTVRSRLFRARHKVQRSLYSWRPNQANQAN